MTSLLDEAIQFLDIKPEQLKNQVILKKKDNVFFLLLNRSKVNSFTKAFTRSIHDNIDEVQKSQGACALVIISLNKVFAAGLDLKYMQTLEQTDRMFFVTQVINLFGRLAVLPLPTICLVNGPAVAGGCMLALSCDIIYAHKKSFFWCNEVQLQLPLPPGMMAVIKRKHNSHQSFRDMVLFSKKFPAQQALKLGMIDDVLTQNLIKNVFERASKYSVYGENRTNFKKLKQQSNKEIVDGCFNKQHGVGIRGQWERKGGFKASL